MVEKREYLAEEESLCVLYVNLGTEESLVVIEGFSSFAAAADYVEAQGRVIGNFFECVIEGVKVSCRLINAFVVERSYLKGLEMPYQMATMA